MGSGRVERKATRWKARGGFGGSLCLQRGRGEGGRRGAGKTLGLSRWIGREGVTYVGSGCDLLPASIE